MLDPGRQLYRYVRFVAVHTNPTPLLIMYKRMHDNTAFKLRQLPSLRTCSYRQREEEGEGVKLGDRHLTRPGRNNFKLVGSNSWA